MSSPVRMGMSTASVIFFSRSVYCHGIMSSSHAMLYFSSALPSRMQVLTPMWPKWSAASGMSMPTTSRTCADVVGHHARRPFGDLDAGEHVLRVGAFAIESCPAGMVSVPGTSRHQVDAEVHLEPGEALRPGAPSGAAP